MYTLEKNIHIDLFHTSIIPHIFVSFFILMRAFKYYSFAAAAAAAKSLQSCLTLCNPRDSSPSGSPIPGILQARTLEWVAISFSNAWKWKVKVKSLSCVRLWVTPRTAAYQAPLSMGFSRQEYWSGVPLPSPPFRYNCLHNFFYNTSLLMSGKKWCHFLVHLEGQRFI